jgi:protein-glutamine gamma-glutamyltransferase
MLKECLVLLVFVIFLREVLILPSVVFVLLGVSLVLLNRRPNNLLRNVLAVMVLVAYWFSYHKVIDPEVGLNFLTTILVLKLLENETLRDRYMIFFGLLLLISSGSLFERSIAYTLFFGVAFVVLIRGFYSLLDLNWSLRDAGKAFLWILPVTGLLFFVVPRVMAPIPFQKAEVLDGEIGYTPNVAPSQVDKLRQSNRPAFRAMVDEPLRQQDLYWRGNTLTGTDGWNWNYRHEEKPHASWQESESEMPRGIKQTIRLEAKDDFFFSLDRPLAFKSPAGVIIAGPTYSLGQSNWKWTQNYEVVSSPTSVASEQEAIGPFLIAPLTKARKNWINETFPDEDPEVIISSVAEYFRNKGFVYSLEPGRIESFEEFMRKRIGFCSHYASATALILRAKKIPTRLVSGFMGGDFSRHGNLYLVSQNDAHVWVEARVKGRWQRVDPTEWIVPERTQLGGEAYMANLSRNQSFLTAFFKAQIAVFQDLRKWFYQWDFRFYQWLEQVDYYGQESWLQKFNLKRFWLYVLVVLIPISFLFIYLWELSRSRRKLISIEQQLWIEFLERASARGLMLSGASLQVMRTDLGQWQNPRKEEFMHVFEKIVDVTFRSPGVIDTQALKKRLKGL